MKPVIVLWTDAYSEDEWMNLDNYMPKSETPNITIGYIVHFQNNYLHVASTIDQDGSNFCSIMAIPYDMIVYVAPLQILSEAIMFGDNKEFERYAEGKFAKRNEMFNFATFVGTVLETTLEPSVLNPPTMGSIQYVANPHQAPRE